MFKYSLRFLKIKALKKDCLTGSNIFVTYFCPMKKQYWFLLMLSGFLGIRCNNTDSTATETPTTSIPIMSYSIIAALPHDTSYYTEGLEFYDSTLLESTGNYGTSKLLQLDPKSGKVLKQVKLSNNYFGEGITVLNDTLYQLTYKEDVVFVYDVKTFKKIKELPFKGEGWGLTNDGKNIIASNGSSSLYYYQPGTFNLIKVLNVTENGNPVININELEYVDGYIYANQYTLNNIVKIDPANGNVISKLDLTDFVNKMKTDPHADVLNGIAYNKLNKKFYVTGKNFSQMLEIQF